MRYRLFFNRSIDWPQCWSVDEGDQSTEINVQGVEVRGCVVRSKVLPAPARSLEGTAPILPIAWFEVDGVLSLAGGTAVFTEE